MTISTAKAFEDTWALTSAAVGTLARGEGHGRDDGGVGHRRLDRVRVGRFGRRRATCSSRSIARRTSRSWRRSRRRLLWRSRARACAAISSPARQSRRPRSIIARRGASRRERNVGRTARADSAESDSRAVRRSSSASAEIDLGEYIAPGTAIVTLQSLDPIFVNFKLPQQQLARRSRRATGRDRRSRRSGTASSTARYGDRAAHRSGHPQLRGAGHAREPGQDAAPRHVRAGAGRARSERGGHGRAADLGRATTRTATRSGSSWWPARAPAESWSGGSSSSAAARGDLVQVLGASRPATRSRPRGCSSSATACRSRSTTTFNPAPETDAAPAEQLKPRMKFTDIFISKPVLAIVVSLLIILVGLRVRPSSSTCASIPELAERRDHGQHRVRRRGRGPRQGFITTPLEREIASAEGIDYIESTSLAGVSSIQAYVRLGLGSERGADPGRRQGQQAARPAARGQRGSRRSSSAVGETTARACTCRSPARCSTTARSPTTCIARRRAQARHIPGVQRAPIIGNGTFAMRVWLESRAHGRAQRHRRATSTTRCGPTTCSSAVGSTKGPMVSVDLTARTDIARRRNSARSSCAPRTARSCAWATSPTWCSAPRTTTRR